MKLVYLIVFVFFLAPLYSQKRQNPHGAISIPCESCHQEKSWHMLRKDMKFDHSKTDFPLNGKHKLVQCKSCHEDLQFHRVGIFCADCHSDVHVGQLGKNCLKCHLPTGWNDQKEIIELHAREGFPLSGVHSRVDCESCHQNAANRQFAMAPFQCVDCHRDLMESTTNPNHIQAGFSTNCSSCHSIGVMKWKAPGFTHTKAFPLHGKHVGVECAACHKNTYKNTSGACRDCHRKDYLNTTNPNHQNEGFPLTCIVCHSDMGWTPAVFKHDITGFPLKGAHKLVDCQSCHMNGYTNTPHLCSACHQKDYDNTTNPNHINAGFSTQCETCHTEEAWSPASFDHATTGFPLEGAHTSVACSDCHKNGYSNTPSDCYSCHKTDYDGTTNPNHLAAHFPTQCENCHTPTNWSNTTWDHDGQYFPIYSGTHRNEWSSCSDCHVNPGNYAEFECINCHKHNKTDTDRKHSEVNNYVYQSSACYNCHPRGKAEGD